MDNLKGIRCYRHINIDTEIKEPIKLFIIHSVVSTIIYLDNEIKEPGIKKYINTHKDILRDIVDFLIVKYNILYFKWKT